MSVFDSIKNAGSSAFDVAKDFGGRFKEERQIQAQNAQADRIARAADAAGMGDGTAKEESFFDRVTTTAKNLGESVSSAARETRTRSPSRRLVRISTPPSPRPVREFRALSTMLRNSARRASSRRSRRARATPMQQSRTTMSSTAK